MAVTFDPVSKIVTIQMDQAKARLMVDELDNVPMEMLAGDSATNELWEQLNENIPPAED